MKLILLAANAALGGLWLVLLFLISFLAVHLVIVVKRGLQASAPPPQEPVKPKENKPPEPVYYIVEKKKKRPKTSYGDPKEIKFR